MTTRYGKCGWIVACAGLSLLGNGCDDTTPPVERPYRVHVAAFGMFEPTSVTLDGPYGREPLLLERDDLFTFDTRLAVGDAYSVTLVSAREECTVADGQGLADESGEIEVTVMCGMLRDVQISYDGAPGLSFSPTELAYRMDVPVLRDAVSVTATPIREEMELDIAGVSTPGGEWSEQIPLAFGENVISLVARYPSRGIQMEYFVSVERARDLTQLVHSLPSHPDSYDAFGHRVAVSADSTTLVVSAPQDEGAVTNDDTYRNGALYVFGRLGNTWVQKNILELPNEGVYDLLGWSLALSADGDILAAGAPDTDRGELDNAGAVYVFERTNEVWSPPVTLVPAHADTRDGFGRSLAMSADGDVLAIGAEAEDSGAQGVNAGQEDNSSHDSGAVYIFRRTLDDWSETAYIKASNTNDAARFGNDVALSADGHTLAVGAFLENSDIGSGEQTSNLALASGAVYMFKYFEGTWLQEAMLKTMNTETLDQFGFSVALDPSGDLLAVGAPFEDGGSPTDIQSQPDFNNAIPNSGAVYLFRRTDNQWNENAYVKPSNIGSEDRFGSSVALSASGTILIVGSPNESSDTTGVQTGSSIENDNANAEGSGAVYLFQASGDSWVQESYIKASNTAMRDQFGSSVALSRDDTVLLVGARDRSMEDGTPETGAVYVFE